MDNITIKRHLRVTIDQLDMIANTFHTMGLESEHLSFSYKVKTVMFLWYMANENCFREISDKFNISQSWGHRIIVRCLNMTCELAAQHIVWPNNCDKITISGNFKYTSGQDNIIGAIDGCHIKILKPNIRGQDYINCKSYFSILLQGICDDQKRFTDVFIGVSGKVHDASCLRISPIYQDWRNFMVDNFLLCDTAYISRDFSFIVTPTRDNGRLQPGEHLRNNRICSGRVVIENCFGILKCRWRRLRDIQCFRMDIIVKIVLSACTLHNICMDKEYICEEHPLQIFRHGCPRACDNDNSEDVQADLGLAL